MAFQRIQLNRETFNSKQHFPCAELVIIKSDHSEKGRTHDQNPTKHHRPNPHRRPIRPATSHRHLQPGDRNPQLHLRHHTFHTRRPPSLVRRPPNRPLPALRLRIRRAGPRLRLPVTLPLRPRSPPVHC